MRKYERGEGKEKGEGVKNLREREGGEGKV